MADDTRERLARLESRIDALSKDIERLEAESVAKAEFEPVKLVAFSVVGVMCLAVLTALIAMVVRG